MGKEHQWCFQLILEKDGGADEHLGLTIGEEGINLYPPACGELATARGHSHPSWGAYTTSTGWLAAIPAHRQQNSRGVLLLSPLQLQTNAHRWVESYHLVPFHSYLWCFLPLLLVQLPFLQFLKQSPQGGLATISLYLANTVCTLIGM